MVVNLHRQDSACVESGVDRSYSVLRAGKDTTPCLIALTNDEILDTTSSAFDEDIVHRASTGEYTADEDEALKVVDLAREALTIVG
ncbi:hypothetical protein JB92DRAFT_3108172 [Gautieria morchelliformis]|nr:hypothetical protein JB92DRAFT_3108172 [Gautieria morchelliformis]